MTKELRETVVNAVSGFANQWPQLFLAIVVIALLAFTLWDASVSDSKESEAWRALVREMGNDAHARERQVAEIAQRIADNGERITGILTRMLDVSDRLEERIRKLEAAFDKLAPRQFPRREPLHHSGQ